MHAMKMAGLLLGAVAWSAASASAATLVAPGTYANTEAPYTNSFPFNTTTHRYQQVYTTAEFGSLPGPVFITQLAFRLDRGAVTFSSTIPNVQIDLSTTARSVEGPNLLSNNFANNVGADNVTVRTGPLSIASSSAVPPLATTPRAFDILIPLTTPFRYDPAAGNLLLDVRVLQAAQTSFFDAVNEADNVARVWVNDVNAAIGSVDSAGLITQFTYVVPEPASAALGALSVATACAAGRWRRRATRG
jgi:hypothetical protein